MKQVKVKAYSIKYVVKPHTDRELYDFLKIACCCCCSCYYYYYYYNFTLGSIDPEG